ncbi:MAG: hypothetical protein KC550_00625 [Nanoarchaeota archaeon]|nr:hypothetical protein [Nanoarchaeota archaeon]
MNKNIKNGLKIASLGSLLLAGGCSTLQQNSGVRTDVPKSEVSAANKYESLSNKVKGAQYNVLYGINDCKIGYDTNGDMVPEVVLTPKEHIQNFNGRFAMANKGEDLIGLAADVASNYRDLAKLDATIANCENRTSDVPSVYDAVDFAMKHGLLKGSTSCEFIDAIDTRNQDNSRIRNPTSVYVNEAARRLCLDDTLEHMYPEKRASTFGNIVAGGTAVVNPILGGVLFFGNNLFTYGSKVIDGPNGINYQLADELRLVRNDYLKNPSTLVNMAERTSNAIVPASRYNRW